MTTLTTVIGTGGLVAIVVLLLVAFG